jgi:hypothetical protein
MIISSTFSAAGTSDQLLVRAGEQFDYSVTAAGGFDGKVHLERSYDGGLTWEQVIPNIAASVASTRRQNEKAKNCNYRFRCSLVEATLTGTAAITLADVVENVKEFKNNSGAVVAAVTETGFKAEVLTIGSTDVTSTASELNILDGATLTVDELNRNDRSLQIETIVKGGVVSISKSNTKIDSTTGTGAVTLAAPDASMYGQIKTIEMTVDNGDITLALTKIVGGSAATTATFSAVGQCLVLLGSTGNWIVLKEYGVALS